MKLAVISSSPIVKKSEKFFAYSPYEKELELWAKYSKEVFFTCPVWVEDRGLLITEFPFEVKKIFEIKSFNIKSLMSVMNAIRYSFHNFHQIYKAILIADHVHLRCPGNVGLMGCIVQIFFPKKIKTAKYAGNWDPNAKQPFSYRIQKWILNNSFLTKNMTVLVYGDWENSSKNIKPFFTASYHETDKIEIQKKRLDSLISFIFVGSLTSGKNPLYAIQLVELLHQKKFKVSLSVLGNGLEYVKLRDYIENKKLSSFVYLLGNKNQEEVKLAYQKSHFVILPSKSEGWPKVVAEGMFWKCLPIATKVSCVPTMLDNGKRGILLEMNLEKDVIQIEKLILDENEYQQKINDAQDWSRKYTLDYFENEIKKLIAS
jgi:glycosyltransferase involved in cell wall biosynthesis